MKPPTSTPTPPQNASARYGLAWLPLPVLLAVILGLWVADLRTSYESRLLLVLTNLIFTWLVSLCIAFVAGRGFLASGQPGLLMLGCGALFWGFATMAAGSLIRHGGNVTITIHNLGVLGAALCFLGGLTQHDRVQQPGRWLIGGYAGVLLLVALLVWAAMSGRTPVFFVQGQGGTLIRQIVLGSAIGILAVTAWLMLDTHRRQPSGFLSYFALGLALLAAGLGGVWLQSVHGSALSWTGRFTQCLGGAYLFIAAMAATRETGGWRISLAAVEEAWRKGELLSTIRKEPMLRLALRYGLAVVAVAAAFGLRLAVTAWIGPGLPMFVTFYPAIMVAAVLGGFGPGALATVLTVLLVNYWILPPSGLFSTISPVDRVGLVIFSCMGLFMSAVAELYRRNKEKAAAYDREVALRESEERLKQVLQASSMGTFEVNPQTGDGHWNEQEFALLGLKPGQAPPSPGTFFRFVHPEDVGLLQAQWKEALRTGILDAEFRVVRADGEERWLAGKGRFLRGNSDGREDPETRDQAPRFQGVNFDITARKQAEQAVRKSEDRLRLALTATNLGTWDFNPVTSELDWDARCKELFGLPPEAEVNYDIFLAGLHPVDRERTHQIVQRAFDPASGGLFDIEYRTVGLRDGGVLRWVRATGQTSFNDAGKPIRFVGTVHDITERKQAEADLEQMRNLLTEGQRIAHLGSWEYIAETQTMIWSDEQKRIYGLAPAAPAPVYAEMLRHHILPEDATAMDKAFGEALRTGSVFENENRIVRPDGSVRHIYNKAQPHFDETGKLVRYVGATLDITERKQAEEALQASLAEKEVLLKEIHHRVKNNMQVLSSLVNLQANTITDPAVLAAFADVRDRVRSMALVHERLYQSGNLASVDFAAYAESLLQSLLRAHAIEAAVHLELALEPVTLTVETAVPCGLILNELVANALKHAFRGRTEGVVTVTTRTGPDGLVSLCVKDDGVGLPDGLDWRRAESLGLRLVQMLSRQMNGTAEVRRPDAGGTEFEIQFPGKVSK